LIYLRLSLKKGVKASLETTVSPLGKCPVLLPPRLADVGLRGYLVWWGLKSLIGLFLSKYKGLSVRLMPISPISP
jgi:hypothetical protein